MAHPKYEGPVIDAHTHWDLEHLASSAEDLKQAGVDWAIMLWDTHWPPHRFNEDSEAWSSVSDRILRCLKPDLTRVGSPGAVSELEKSIRQAAAAGAVGIKIWKNLGLHLTDHRGERLAIDDDRLRVIWDVAGELGLPISVHQGDHRHHWDPLTPANPRYNDLQQNPDWWYGDGRFPGLSEIQQEFEEVVAANPNTTFIGVHFGCFLTWENIRRMFDSYPNYNVDTATALCDLGASSEFKMARQLFLDYPDRIVFGSDLIRSANWKLPAGLPISDYFERHWRVFESDEAEIPMPLEDLQGGWTLHGLDLPLDVLERLYFRNAYRIFQLGRFGASERNF